MAKDVDKYKLKAEREALLEKIRKKNRKKKENKRVQAAEEESREAEPEVKKEKPKPKKKVTSSEGKDDKRSSRDILKEKIKELENEISNTKYNKRTQHAIGLKKAQLANLKKKLSENVQKASKAGDGYAVRKSGDATVVLLGFPSAGKSTLLNQMTDANSEVGEYAFTTLKVIPGVLEYKSAKIQILDVPGIVEGAADGIGRGKEVLQVLRAADLIVMLVDATKPEQKDKLEREVYKSNIRINRKNPDVIIKKTSKNGIRIGRTVLTPDLDDDTIQGMLKQFRILNAEVLIREEITADQLIDVVEGNKVYLPSILTVNKVDLIGKRTKFGFQPDLSIIANSGHNIDKLKEMIYEQLNLIKIYLKEINEKADMDEPMIMKQGDTLKDLCARIHKDFIHKFRFARIWGSSVKFPGQKILKLGHQIRDEDVIEIHTR